MATLYKDVPHLVFRAHSSQEPLDIVVTEEDKKILRELGKRVADVGTLPVQQQRKAMWTRMNSLQDTRAMVWINEVCWNEMDTEGELTLRTGSPFCRRIETELRLVLYQWEHMPCDMVVEPVIYAPQVVENSGVGINVEEDIATTDTDNLVVSHRFHIQIRGEDDIEKITFPKVVHHQEKSEANLQAYRDIFDGILQVEQGGSQGFWFAPWDDIITWTGVEEALMDLALRPAYIHKIIDRLVNAYLHALDQYEELNLLALNNSNVRIGSGAYGYTDELPQPEADGDHVRTSDIWGCATAQIFSAISPEMHQEFALPYEKRWLKRFGLTYYGCCEPLHNKLDILKSIPNLRKISISPWANLNEAAEQTAGDYVLSLKPSPAVFAQHQWHPELAREELQKKLKIAKAYGCNVEIVMKDISTVHHQPERLWQWAAMASEICQEHYG